MTSVMKMGPTSTEERVVRITIEGGIVQDVEVPAGITVIIRDYDTDGYSDEELQHAIKDEQGDFCFETVW